MRLAILFLVLFVVTGYAYADNFGERFVNQSPTALGDLEPQDIEPAAGEPYDTEDELENKFQTNISTTVNEFVDGDTKRHDSVGDGNIRLFYQNDYDDRMMDNQDAIGVEMKVIEFK